MQPNCDDDDYNQGFQKGVMGREAGGKDGGEAAKKKPKAVGFKKFVSRALDRIGGSDNMELEPKFIADMEQHNKYADALDKMNQAITHLVAPGMMKKTVVGKEEQDKPPDAVEKNKKKEEKKEKEKDPPIKLLAAHLQKMAAATNPHDRLAGKVYLQSLDKMGKAFTDLHSMNAEYKVQLNNLLPHIVEHHQSEATFVKNQKRMIQYLDEINLMREDVKKASTTAKVRDVGKQYEHAVNNFDRVAAAVDAVIAADSKGASDHQRDFINFCAKRCKYHENVADLLQKMDKDLTPLLQEVERDLGAADKKKDKKKGDKKAGKQK